jgi:hypothetical protein
MDAFFEQQCRFAPNVAMVGSMTRDEPKIKTISASELRHLKDRAFVRRSDVYRYLAKNYQRLVRQKVGTTDGPSWDETAAVMSRRGYLGARGCPLNGNAVRRVFRRVEEDIRRREAEGARQRAKSHRSRQREDWEPPLARTERPAGRRAPPPPPPKPPSEGAYDHLPEDVKAQLTAVDEQFAYLDRHIIRPKQRS